jgi:hypothetical protein
MRQALNARFGYAPPHSSPDNRVKSTKADIYIVDASLYVVIRGNDLTRYKMDRAAEVLNRRQ